jgi:hypothetical protein
MALARPAFRLFSALFVIASAAACGRASPPEPDVVDPTTAPLGAPFDAGDVFARAQAQAAQGGDAALPSSPTATTQDAEGDGGTGASAAPGGPDPSTLPQTNEKPHASGAGFDARIAALWKGIVSDSPDDAMPFFFPVHAYEQVKAIPNPAGDWRRRLVAAYTRDIHKLHQRLGDDASRAKFQRVEVPEERARWVEPNEESNKLGYYRVYGTRIWYEIDGKSRSIDVTSLISWRGEWYVVHLSGFK